MVERGLELDSGRQAGLRRDLGRSHWAVPSGVQPDHQQPRRIRCLGDDGRHQRGALHRRRLPSGRNSQRNPVGGRFRSLPAPRQHRAGHADGPHGHAGRIGPLVVLGCGIGFGCVLRGAHGRPCDRDHHDQQPGHARADEGLPLLRASDRCGGEPLSQYFGTRRSGVRYNVSDHSGGAGRAVRLPVGQRGAGSGVDAGVVQRLVVGARSRSGGVRVHDGGHGCVCRRVPGHAAVEHPGAGVLPGDRPERAERAAGDHLRR